MNDRFWRLADLTGSLRQILGFSSKGEAHVEVITLWSDRLESRQDRRPEASAQYQGSLGNSGAPSACAAIAQLSALQPGN
jgi:hypothetical protein